MTPPESSELPAEPAGAAGPTTRRRRRRATARQKQSSAAQPAVSAEPVPERPRRQPAAPKRTEKSREADRSNAAGSESGQSGQSGQYRDSDRGWRELAGNAPSQVGPQGAMRARDLNRPTAEDLAAAERDVVIVRRQWQPPEAKPDR